MSYTNCERRCFQINILRIKTVLIFLLATHILYGQADEFVFSKFGPSEGLPSSEVYNVHQDKDGFLWVCTDRGISRYDGYSFENFNTSTPGISDNTVFKAFEIGDEIWFNCFDGSVFIYNKLKKVFRNFKPLKTSNGANWVHDIFHNEKYIYVFYTRKQTNFDRIDKASGERIEMDIGSFMENYSINNGIYSFAKYDEFPKHVFVLDSKKKYSISNLCIFKNNNQVTFNNTVLYFFNEKEILKKIDLAYQIIGIKIIENQVFVYGKNGLSVVNNNFQIKSLMSAYSVTDINKDFEGNFWISTLHNGLLKLTSMSKSIIDLNLKKKERILCFEKIDNHLVMGSSAGRYFIYNKNTSKTFTDYTIPSRSRISNLFVYENKLNINNEILLHTSKKKLIHTQTKSSLSGISIFFNKHRIEANYTYAYSVIAEDKQQIKKSAFKEKIIHMVAQDSSVVYFATLKGVYRVDKADLLHPKLVYPSVLPTVRINKIYIKNSFVFVATSGKGAYCIYKDNALPIKGLSSTIINSFSFVGDSLLYVASNRGIDKFKLQRKGSSIQFHLLESYSSKDHLISDYIYDLAEFDDTIYYSSDVGLAKIPINKIYYRNTTPKLIVHGVFASGESESIYPYDFKPKQNDLVIKYIGISNSKPEKNFYKYKLINSGEEEDWKFTDSREILLSDIKPGTYQMLISVRNYQNKWSQPKVISFSVQASLIQKTWFQGFIGFIVILAIVIAISLRIKFLRKKENEKLQLEQMENKYTEAALSSLKSQINPHFIFNALQSVQGYILRNETNLANEYLNKFSKLIRSGLLYSTLEFISVEEEVEFLTYYLDIEKLRFPNRLKYKLQVNEKLIVENIKMPPLLLQPFCENVVKHAFEKDSLTNNLLIEFALDDTETFIHCTIKDNGVGFIKSKGKEKDLHTSKGISLVENRINLLVHKYGIGSLSINSEQGTIVKMTLPIE